MIFQDKQPTSISQTLARLRNQGYQLGFRREATCIYCFELQERIMPEDFTVDESYYFEDVVNPDADRILYAISLSKGRRGFLIDACNAYSDNISYEMEQKLQWQYPLLS
jgi:hypothetical protein